MGLGFSCVFVFVFEFFCVFVWAGVVVNSVWGYIPLFVALWDLGLVFVFVLVSLSSFVFVCIFVFVFVFVWAGVVVYSVWGFIPTFLAALWLTSDWWQRLSGVARSNCCNHWMGTLGHEMGHFKGRVKSA